MKYVCNAFSPNMVDDGATVRFTRIEKREFVDAIPQSYCVIGHEEIARAFNVECNRRSISLLEGDVLYIVSPSHRPSGEVYEFIPESKGWIYRRIEVIPQEDDDGCCGRCQG